MAFAQKGEETFTVKKKPAGLWFFKRADQQGGYYIWFTDNGKVVAFNASQEPEEVCNINGDLKAKLADSTLAFEYTVTGDTVTFIKRGVTDYLGPENKFTETFYCRKKGDELYVETLKLYYNTMGKIEETVNDKLIYIFVACKN